MLAAVFAVLIISNTAMAYEKPEIFVQMGHQNNVQAAAFSLDGRYLATGSEDKTVKLWDVATGTEIRTFLGHTVEVTAVAISSDGRQILSGDEKGFIKLWDTVSGQEIRSMTFTDKGRIQIRGIQALRFSPEGRFFTSLTLRNLTVWDANTGKIVKRNDNIRGNCFRDSGEFYVAAKRGNNGDFALLESSSGKEIRNFRSEDRLFSKVSFSQNGKYALFMEEDSGQKKYIFSLFDIDTGNKVSSWQMDTAKFISNFFLLPNGTQAITAETSGLTLRNALQGKVARVLTTSATFFVHLSPDGKFILSSGNYAPTLWDSAFGRVVRYFRGRSLSTNLGAVYHPNGKQILIKRDGASPLLLDSASGSVNKIFEGYTSGRFVADGRYLLLVGKKTGIQIWDFVENKVVKTFRGEEVLLSKDDRYLAEKIGDREFKIWETSTVKEVLSYLEPSGKIRNFNLSDDNRYLLLCIDNRVKMIDIATGREERSFVVPTEMYYAQTSRDGRYLVAFYNDDRVFSGILKIWDLQSNREITTVHNLCPLHRNVDFSPDGKSVLVDSYTETLITDSLLLIDLATGRRIRTFKGQNIWAREFSDDGRLLATGDADGSILLWDAVTGERKMFFAGTKNAVRTLRFSPDQRQIVSTGLDGPTRLWDINTGKEIAQFISFTDGEWIVITPEGYFNASPNGAKHLNVRIGNRVYSIDNFYERFFDPVYVASVLQGKKVEAVADIRKGVAPPPDVRITSPEPNETFSTDTISITVSAKDTGGGIDEIRLYHNGKAIGEDHRSVKIAPKGNEVTKTYAVTLVDGLNTFRAVGFSKDRTESNPYELIVKLTAPSKDVSMYILAVGINKYKNPALNLNYAEPDARGIVDFFKQRGKGLFKNVALIEIYNEQATKQGIASKLKQLQNTQPQDAVLIYLAGHGESLGDKWYFIPHEITYPEREEDVKTKGVSSEELSGYIKDIKAQKILMLIDACKSGAVMIAFRGFEDRKALSQLSRSTGVHIIAASTKDQFAAEVKELGHGVFTYTLLEGLKGKALGRGETVTVRKLMGYVEEQLPDITKKYKQEAQYPVVDSRGMDFPLVIVK